MQVQEMEHGTGRQRSSRRRVPVRFPPALPEERWRPRRGGGVLLAARRLPDDGGALYPGTPRGAAHPEISGEVAPSPAE